MRQAVYSLPGLRKGQIHVSLEIGSLLSRMRKKIFCKNRGIPAAVNDACPTPQLTQKYL